ncbi:MAG: NAD-dependent epimerase/dehydratase family protein [Myxococcales bacterium]|nr:NAD-dependent epimerase/dehydratase family protein [Myxococcales bacterium]
MSGVLVTGATTPLGLALIEGLLAEPELLPILALGVEPESSLPRLPPSDRLHYRQVDLTRARAVRALLYGEAKELGIHAIAHCARHRRAGDRGRRVYALNVECTRQLLHLAERHPSIRRFVLRSTADVYRVAADQPVLIDEQHPIRISTRMPQWLRDRVEADLLVSTAVGQSPLSIGVLRFAELFAPESGSQLFDFLRPGVCFRPLGYDPMLHVLSLRDAVRALILALRSDAHGIFNIPGRDILPLSACIRLAGRREIVLPGPLLSPIYGLRRFALRAQFSYGMNEGRFHFSGVLDGSRAAEELGFRPRFYANFDEARAG